MPKLIIIVVKTPITVREPTVIQQDTDAIVHQPNINISSERLVTLSFDEPTKPTEATDWEGVGTPYNSVFFMQWRKSYTQDITDTVAFQDTAGNTVRVPIHIDNIDKISPTATLTPTSTDWTNTNRTWTANFNETVYKPSGWNGAITGTTFTKQVSKNETVAVTATDLAGNVGTSSATESKIDKNKPIITNITHSPSDATTEAVTITVSASDDLSGISGYAMGSGNYQSSNQFTVTANGNYNFTVIDSAGNYVVSTHNVGNITVGIKDIENKNLNIYPNPAHSYLRIETAEPVNNVEIYDIYNRIPPLNPPEGGKLPSFGGDGGGITIDISHLANGLYFLKIGNKTVKIIKN